MNASGPLDESYDVVVVGAGLAGLTAGALLADAGMKTLVVERGMEPGGCARSLHRGGYTFDTADHLIMSCAPDGPFGPGLVDAVLRHLGVRDRCEFARVDAPFYEARFPGLACAVPAGRDAFIDAHLRHFPGGRDGLTRLAELSGRAFAESQRFPVRPRLPDLVRAPWRFPTFFRYRNATAAAVIDAELGDARLKALYESLFLWMGAPPSEFSFPMWAMCMGSYIDDGAYYCRGGFGVLVDALVLALRRAGGELVLGIAPQRVVADHGVRGVVLDDGRRIATSTVVWAADPRTTFALVGPDAPHARYLDRLRRMELTPIAVGLYVATDLDAQALGAHHESMVFSGWDHEATYRAWRRGEMPAICMAIPTLTDSSLAPSGQHVITIHSFAPPDPDRDDAAADAMLTLAEQVLPGLRNRLTYVEGADRPGAHRFPLHRMGPIYGWALTPNQSGTRRLGPITPIRGLYLAGQWTQPSPGVMPVIASGLRAARLVLGVATRDALLPVALQHRAATTATRTAK